MKAPFCFLLMLLFLVQCRKFDETEASFETYQVSSNSIEKVFFINDTLGFACGGKRHESGQIFKTIDGGNSWIQQTIFHADKKVYEVYFLNELTGFAGTEDNFIYTTQDGGDNWQLELSLPVGYHEVHRPIVRQFTFLDNNVGYFVCGQNYEVGTLYKTTDQGLTWAFDSLNHEMRGIHFMSEESGICSGYGYIASLKNGNISRTQLDHPDGFFTAIHMFNENEIITIDQNGGIYKSQNGGEKWKKVLHRNRFYGRRFFFSDMVFAGHTGLISGNDGVLLISHDKGDTWEQIKGTPDTKLNRISILGNNAYVGCDNGSILKVDI